MARPAPFQPNVAAARAAKLPWAPTDCILFRMPDKPRTVRLDDAAEAAVDFLYTQFEDLNFSDLVRTALIETATAHRRRIMREQSEALRNDPEDLAEVRAIMADMDALTADSENLVW